MDVEHQPAVAVAIAGFPSERSRYANRIAVLLEEAGDEGTAVLDALIRTAAEAADAKFAQVSVLTDRQLSIGLLARDETDAGCFTKLGALTTPMEDSVCSWALRGHEVIDIPDAARDARVSTIPAVTSGFLAAYLGVPVQSAGGHTLGVLCVGDTTPRPWTGDHVATLIELAAQVSAELDRLACVDMEATR